MPRSSRLALWCLALLLCLSLYIKGRVPTGKGEGAAFLRYGTGAGTAGEAEGGLGAAGSAAGPLTLPATGAARGASSNTGAGFITVRLAGDFPRPGLYRFPDGASVEAAIKMTLPDAPLAKGLNALAHLPLASGDVVTLSAGDGQGAVFSTDRMGVKELMLLGIPLDPDRLQVADWACLPGIGPALSERIVADRHKNGAFGAVENLLRVRGIGPGKLAAIRRYF